MRGVSTRVSQVPVSKKLERPVVVWAIFSFFLIHQMIFFLSSRSMAGVHDEVNINCHLPFLCFVIKLPGFFVRFTLLLILILGGLYGKV